MMKRKNPNGPIYYPPAKSKYTDIPPHADIITLLNSPHTDEDYAECFVKLYKNIYYYDNHIYEFRADKNRWVKYDDGRLYEFLGKRMYMDLREVLDKKFKSIEMAKQHADIAKHMLRLRSRSGRSGIVESIKPKILVSHDKWDMNPDLIGFDNGVYDLKQHIFRNGKPDDYISFSVGYEYQPRDEAKLQSLRPFINQILPDPQVRDYLLKCLSTALWGKTIQKFFILTGEGSNGKDTLISKLFARTLGDDYFYDADNCIITDKRKSSGPNVGIANMHKKRFVLFSEPDKRSTLQGGIIKQFTGADRINARGLYSSNTITQLQLTAFCLCNDIPTIDEIDGGVARRMVVIPFDSLFKTKEEIKECKNTKNIFEINSYYDSEEFFQGAKLTLFHMLTDYLKVFQAEGNIVKHEPTRIKKLSRGYLEDCDDLIGWFRDEYEKADGCCIKIKDIFDKYKHSSYYMKLNKKDRRYNNKRRFTEKIRTHPVLRGHYMERYQPRINGVQKCYTNVLVGFKIREMRDDYDDEKEKTPDYRQAAD